MCAVMALNAGLPPSVCVTADVVRRPGAGGGLSSTLTWRSPSSSHLEHLAVADIERQQRIRQHDGTRDRGPHGDPLRKPVGRRIHRVIAEVQRVTDGFFAVHGRPQRGELPDDQCTRHFAGRLPAEPVGDRDDERCAQRGTPASGDSRSRCRTGSTARRQRCPRCARESARHGSTRSQLCTAPHFPPLRSGRRVPPHHCDAGEGAGSRGRGAGPGAALRESGARCPSRPGSL